MRLPALILAFGATIASALPYPGFFNPDDPNNELSADYVA